MSNQPSEARAQQSERLLQHSWPRILDNMQEFSAVVDRSGTILYRNRTSATPAVLIGSKIYDAVRPDDRDAMRAALRRAFQTGEVQLCEVVSRFSGASYRARLVPIVEDVQVVAVFVGAADISEQKRMEEGLRDSLRTGESQDRALLEATPDLIFRLDGEGRFLDFVSAKGQEPALPPAEFLGRTVCEVMPIDLAAETMRHLGQALQTGDTQVFEYQMTVPLPNGNLRDFEGRMAVSGNDEVLAVVRDITERKRAEGRLRLLSSAVEQSSEGMAVSDLAGNLLFVNNAFAAMHGYAPEELVGKRLSVFHTPEQAPAVDAANQQTRETGEFSGDIWHVQRDGTVFPTLMHNSLLRDEGGTPIGLVGTLRDITERKRAEEALRESEERFRGLAETSIDGILLVESSEVRFANAALVRMCGYESDKEIVGRPFTDFVSPDYRELMVERGRARNEGLDVPDRYEFRSLRKDGSEFDAEISVSTMTYRGGWARLGIIRDVSERKRAEQALRESEERFRRLSEATLDGVIIHDDGLVLDANARAAAIHGYELSEFIGMDVLTFIAPEWHDLVRQRTLSGHGESYEVWGLRKDGTTFPMEVCGKTTSYEGRQVRVGVGRDISERKRAEEALQRAREDLEARAEQRLAAAGRYKLTFRDLTVLYLIADGMADKEIAFRLGISPRTASKHVENILQKMGVPSRTQASVQALREGLVGDAR